MMVQSESESQPESFTSLTQDITSPIHDTVANKGVRRDVESLQVIDGQVLDVIDLSDDISLGDELDSTKAVAAETFGLSENSTSLERIKTLSVQSSPVIISFFLNLGGVFITLLFAARFVPNDEYGGDSSVLIAGVNLANLFANVSCLSILIGMSSAVETLGSQHNGAGNYKEVGIVLQRSICILMTLALPVLMSWFFAYDIFRAVGVEHDVGVVIAGYLQIRAISVPIDVINFSYEKYLMSIGVMQPSMWANITFNIALVVFNSIFIIGLRCRFRFLAVSWILSAGCLFVVQIGMSLQYEEVKRSLQPMFTEWARFSKWGEFFSLGLPGTIMLCSEWWAFECLTLMAASLGTEEVAAQATIMQIASMSFMIPMGLGVATASFVGNFIGAGRRNLAVSISHLSLSYIALLEIILGALIISGGKYFVQIFTSDERVRQVAESAIPFLSLFTMIDGLQGVGSGVLRGAGKQYFGAAANVVAFYGCGLPMAAALCFHWGFGVDGLIMGIAFATTVQVIVLFTLIFGFESYLFGAPAPKKQVDTTATHNSNTSIGEDRSSNTNKQRGKISMFPKLNHIGGIEFKRLNSEEDESEKRRVHQTFSILDADDDDNEFAVNFSNTARNNSSS